MFKGKNITLYAGDFFEVNANLIGHFDGIYDRAALVALLDNTRERYVKKIIQLITPNTQMLLVAASYLVSQIQGLPFSVDLKKIKRLYAQCGNINVLYAHEAGVIFAHLATREFKEAHEYVV